MSETNRRYVGSSVRPIVGEAAVAGRATYTADLAFHGQLHAHILRSPHASARIRSVDLSGATKVSGVVLAMDGQQAAKHLGPLPHHMDPAVFGGNTYEIRSLATDKVWCFGQPVAVVVAESKSLARYAASRIRVDYEPLPAAVTTEEAAAPGAPVVVPGWTGNTIMSLPFVNGAPDDAFARADRVVRTRVRIQRFSTQPIEPRVYNAVPDPATHGLTLYCTCQNPNPLRHILSAALGIPQNRIRVVAPTIGGAFGAKMPGHPEEPLICLLALLTGRPVRWAEDREELLLIGAREQAHDVELALTLEGDILGIRDRASANTGAPSACPGWGMAFLTGLTMPGPYRVTDLDVQMNILVSNKPSWNASRGYGKEITALALELSIDQAARELGIDPAAIRIRNFLRKDQFPYPSPTGLLYDSGDYAGALEKALGALDYAGWRARQATARAEGRLVGIGIGYELTPEGGAIPGTMTAGWDSCSVRVAPDGSVTLLTGVTSPGSGNETGLAQIVADELGVQVEGIQVIQGDTTTCPYGFGNYSGRSLLVAGNAAATAAREVRAKLLEIAARLLDVPVAAVLLERGVFTTSAPTERQVTLQQAAYAAYANSYDIGLSIVPPLEATATFRPGIIRHTPDEKGRINPYPSYSSAAFACVCEVDPATGQVKLLKFTGAHDCGRVINPTLVEGQACGAIGFGIGAALTEEICCDASGRQLTTNFTDYVMPRAADVPPITMVHHDCPNPVTYMGLKGAGEAGVGGSAAAVVNAVNDALAPLGVAITDLPLTAAKVWAAMDAARGGPSAEGMA